MKRPVTTDTAFAIDIGIIAASIVAAVVLAETNVLSGLLATTESAGDFGSFIAGIFFTSVFTTAPAIVTLGEIAREHSVVTTAFFAALGAAFGDLLIFRFVQDRLSGHLAEILVHRSGARRLRALLSLKYFRWLTFLAGGLIIASPLPDELGVALLGAARMNVKYFLPLSFVFNFAGILLIGLAARAL